jgi:non-heme chloroperoxidase
MEEGTGPGVDRFIAVNGVTLHYLDWGGSGPALLFLTGLGNSARIFDDLAPRFTDRFHVLALTRRGHGRSQVTETGYDTGTLTEDVHSFLAALGISRVSLVGHSLAGDELTRFVALYPERVDRMVYLDAAYDRTTVLELHASMPVELPDDSTQVWDTWEDAEGSASRFYPAWSEATRRETHEILAESAGGGIRSRMPDDVQKALMRGTSEAAPDFTSIVAPTLCFYAFPNTIFDFVELSDAHRQLAETWTRDAFLPYVHENAERFRREVPRGTVIEMCGAHHYCFLDRPEEVYEHMRAFLLAEG